ncbi:MAG: hypothetical protein ACK559_15785, partial [bacterium]
MPPRRDTPASGAAEVRPSVAPPRDRSNRNGSWLGTSGRGEASVGNFMRGDAGDGWPGSNLGVG